MSEENRGTTGRAQDAVVHPLHYNNHPSGLECVDLNEVLPANLACVLKYVWRRNEKGNVVRDLSKALWYAEREAAHAALTPLYQRTIVTYVLDRSPLLPSRLAQVDATEVCVFPEPMSPLSVVVAALIDFLAGRIQQGLFFGVIVESLRDAIEREKAKAAT